jgi:hypothetical protein
LDRFKQLAEPLGAVLNTEKTRILTTTTGSSLVTKLLLHPQMRMNMRGKLLEQAISKYSVKLVNGNPTPVEVTDGLHVLGAPIGSTTFAQDFMQTILNNAINDSQKLLSGLDDSQTMMRLFSTCTVHKITHLFGSDVFHAPVETMPQLFYLWESNLCNNFTQMVENFICQLTSTEHLPPHSSLISTLTVNQGGLGLQHPRANAITAYMTSSKRCLQYAFEGVWLGRDKPRPLLPPSITSLYSSWQTDSAKSWSIFRQYLPTFTSISIADAAKDTDYIFKASLNGSREKMKEYSSRMMKKNVLFDERVTPAHIRSVLPSVLDRRASLALMTMPRLEEENRMKNDNFVICLKRKLRLRIIDDTTHYVCKCGQQLDCYGDHCLACPSNTKTKASNGIRDGIVKTLQTRSSHRQTHRKLHSSRNRDIQCCQISSRLKPFDLSIRLDHSLDPGSWRTHLSRIGFDVTIIHATRPSVCTPSEAAQFTESDLRLRDKEKQKFARRNGGTNKLTRRTLTADGVIGEIIDSNNSFIPIAVGPNGEFGSLFRRFLHGFNPLPLPTFRNWPSLTKPPSTSWVKLIKIGKETTVTNCSAEAS